MTKKKLDRASRIASKVWSRLIGENPSLDTEQSIDVIRCAIHNEHRWMARMVREIQDGGGLCHLPKPAVVEVCDRILTKLKARAL